MILYNKNAIIIYRGVSEMDKMTINIDNFDKTSDGRVLVPENLLNKLIEFYQTKTYIEEQKEIAKQMKIGKIESYTLEEVQQILEDGHF